MSNARKCDRCGKCFDPFKYGDKTMMARFQNPVFQNSDQIKDHNVGYYLIEDSADSYVDLCPDCTRDFEAFMEGNPIALHENSFDEPDISNSNDKKKESLQDFWEESERGISKIKNYLRTVQNRVYKN